jgi:DNA-binding response OmpR family regulator
MTAIRSDVGEVSQPEDAMLVRGNLVLRLESFRALLDGRVIDLTYHEFDLLRAFCEQPGRVISYEALVHSLWGASGRKPVRHLNVLVHRLRTKLAGLRPYVIETVRGRGYGLLLALDGDKAAGAETLRLGDHATASTGNQD